MALNKQQLAKVGWGIVFYGPITAMAALLRLCGVDVMRLRRPHDRGVSLWVRRDAGRDDDMRSQR